MTRQARETLRLQERGTELMRDVAEARSNGKALSEENNGLRTALAKLTLEWWAMGPGAETAMGVDGGSCRQPRAAD